MMDHLAKQIARFRVLLNAEERLHHSIRDQEYIDFLKARIETFLDELEIAKHDVSEGGAAER